jgi:glucose-1-phosphate cytidylyltransferase
MEKLAFDSQLHAYQHTGFWRSMDTLKDKNDLTALWTDGKAPWALWL